MFIRYYAQVGPGFRGFPGANPEPTFTNQWSVRPWKAVAGLLLWTGLVLAGGGVLVPVAVLMILVGIALLIAGFGLPGSGLPDSRSDAEPGTTQA